MTRDSCFERVFFYNLYGPLFVYITECVLDNTGMDGTLSIKWRTKKTLSHVCFITGNIGVKII